MVDFVRFCVAKAKKYYASASLFDKYSWKAVAVGTPVTSILPYARAFGT